MNKKLIMGWLTVTLACAASAASAASWHAATVTLDGNWYLQAGQVLNQSSVGITLTEVQYSMGDAVAGAGIWEQFESTGTHTQTLDGTTTYYSTEVWSHLALGSNQSFQFSGLDIDRIINLDPVDIDNQNLDTVGTSLSQAYVQLSFSDGYQARLSLAEQGWNLTQTLHFSDQSQFNGIPAAPVPEPSTWLLWAAGLAVTGGHRWSSRRR